MAEWDHTTRSSAKYIHSLWNHSQVNICFFYVLCLKMFFYGAGILKDPDKGGKSYAVYAITVKRKLVDGEEDVWDVYRRYSDFHDLHMCITEKVSSVCVEALKSLQ